jgi:hypothetical protein
VHDIAKEAGVSLATVDRVLNARPGVREKTITKVQEAVARLGYVRDTYAANLARQRQYRFVFILPDGPSQFAQSLKGAIHEAYASQIADRTVIKVIRVPITDPHAIVRALQAASADGTDGIALMVPETPQVRDAISRLKDAGVAVVTLVSDLPNSRRDFAQADDLTLCWAAWDPANALIELSQGLRGADGPHDEVRIRALAELRRPDAERAELGRAALRPDDRRQPVDRRLGARTATTSSSTTSSMPKASDGRLHPGDGRRLFRMAEGHAELLGAAGLRRRGRLDLPPRLVRAAGASGRVPEKYGRDLGVPATLAELKDIAEFFQGREIDGTHRLRRRDLHRARGPKGSPWA